jgi:hypothetical protein
MDFRMADQPVFRLALLPDGTRNIGHVLLVVEHVVQRPEAAAFLASPAPISDGPGRCTALFVLYRQSFIT